MSERNKEFVLAGVLFALAVPLGLYASLGKSSLGAMSLLSARLCCAIWFLGCAICGTLALIGNRRLNVWINPRIEACLDKRKRARQRRRSIKAELDLKYPNRVTQREKRKELLYCIAGWALLASPLAMIVVSVVLKARLKTGTWCAALAVLAFYVMRLWCFFLKTFLQSREK